MDACSQGGVQFPTGGIPASSRRARERLSVSERVSRSGAKPEPTVTVRMKEDEGVFSFPYPCPDSGYFDFLTEVDMS